LVSGNFSKDNKEDFYNQNNDFQDGVIHSHIVSHNIIDHTNSEFAYGVTESRGIGFTSCYGGMNIANAMIGIKGDSATHLENIQETMHGFNYYRDCWKDVLFSGLTNRRLIQINTISGINPIEVGDTLNGVSSGASGLIHFWYPDSRTAQVINITGSFQNTENYTITSKDTNGALRYVDPVQVHANVIGNIFHKTNTETKDSTSLGSNGYALRHHFIGNIYNAQTAKGGGNKAVSCALAFDSTHTNGVYRGWDTAFAGATQAVAVNIKDSFFWNNTDNILSTIWQDSKIEGNKFFDGSVTIGDLRNSTLEGNEFIDGEIDIQSTTNDNKWLNNKVSTDVTLTNLNPADFEVWESTPYGKIKDTHRFTVSGQIAGVGDDDVLTLTPIANGVSVSIEFNLTGRASTSGGGDIGRAFIYWTTISTPVITLDIANFQAGPITVTLTQSGNDVIVRVHGSTGGFNNYAGDINIKSSGVTVLPVEFLDRT